MGCQGGSSYRWFVVRVALVGVKVSLMGWFQVSSGGLDAMASLVVVNVSLKGWLSRWL